MRLSLCWIACWAAGSYWDCGLCAAAMVTRHRRKKKEAVLSNRVISLSGILPATDARKAPHQGQIFEAQMGAGSGRFRRIEGRINRRLKKFRVELRHAPRVQMGAAGSAHAVVGHEDLHLSDRQVLDVLFRHARLLGLGDAAEAGALVVGA